MQEVLADAGAELLVLAGQALVAVVLTLAGAAAELNALASLTGGDLVVGAWLGYMGAIALYAGLFVVGPDVLDGLSDGDAAAPE